MPLEWTDKVDNVDYINAKDVNDLAHAIKEREDEDTQQNTKINKNKDDIATNAASITRVEGKADGAVRTADNANSTAEAANKTAGEAKQTADTASNTADAAVKTANTAKNNADEATRTANSASETADEAKRIAGEAKTNADTAVLTANTAKQTADGLQSQVTTNAENIGTNTAEISNNRASIEKHTGELGKLDKRVTFLEGATLDVVEDNTAAYIKDVPVGAKPYAEIGSIGGNTYKSDNLIPFPYALMEVEKNGVKWTANNDGSVSSSGTATGYSDFTIYNGEYFTETFTVLAKSTSLNVSLEIGITDADNQPITHPEPVVGNPLTFRIEDYPNAKKLRIKIKRSADNQDITGLTNVMLNYGESAKPYSHYFEGLRNTKCMEVKLLGANLIPDTAQIQKGYYYDEGGQSSGESETECRLTKLSILPNTKYCLSSNIRLYTVWFYQNNIALHKVNASGNSFAFTTPSNANLIGISFSGNISTFEWAMLNFGDTALPYTPHINLPSLPIPAEVQELPDYGAGVGDCINPIQFKDGAIKYLHNCEIKTINEACIDSITYLTLARHANGFRMKLKNYYNPSHAGVCDKYRKARNMGDTEGVLFGAESVTILTKLEDNITTAEQFLSKLLRDTPVITYPLRNPTETDISQYFPNGGEIEVQGGGSIVFENELKQPVPSDVAYMVERSVTA